ncbi:MAG: lipopolysaccharide heptosyltransferase II [Acidobacteria bacterium]|nr:MAG: lipopolysaccharide heptosyltransferase II [Acidobacteriota bacterium]
MKILVRGTNWIGDAVMTLPAIAKLRRLFPDARLTLHTRDWARGILNQSGLFDEIITPTSFPDQIGAIRKGNFDLAVIFPNSFSSALVVRLGGAKRSFGYAAERRSMLLTDPVTTPEWKDSRHEVYYYLELVAAIEKSFFGKVTEAETLEPKLSITDEQRRNAIEILRESGIDPTLKTVAIAGGSTNSRAKRWLPESFAALADRLRSEMNVNVILLGSKDDEEISKRVADLATHRPVDLTGMTDIVGAAALLASVDVLVSNDMGLAHLAPAVGTKTLVIFGPTNAVTTRPMSTRAEIISANVECAPCMLRDCPIDHRCMTRVTVDDVYNRVAKVLSE